jgi:proline iminopeptidase
MPELFPPTPDRRTRWPVTGGHELQLYEWGDPQGQPALLLHGGPGSGLTAMHARFFDPGRFRVIGFDQRGAGRSAPAGGVEHNTTAELLADIRALRAHLGIARWLVVGGSWGATLALLHATDLPDAVTGLLLRGSFVGRREDVDAFFAAHPAGFDDAWQPWRERAARAQRPFIDTLDQVLQQGGAEEQQALAATWWRFEQAMDGDATAAAPDAAGLLPRCRVQAHYLRHGCWLDDEPLLQRLHKVPNVPTLLLHGEQDRICPLAGAQAIHARLPHARLRRIGPAGHAPTHPAMSAAMVRALDRFAVQRRFDDDDDDDDEDEHGDDDHRTAA